MKMFHIHKWSDWSEPYEIQYTYGEFGVHYPLTQRKRAQERTCKTCGKIYEKYIGYAKEDK